MPIDATIFTLALSPGHEVTSCVSTFASRPQVAAPHLQASAFSNKPFVLAHFIICSHTPEDSWQNEPVPGMLTLFSTVVHVCPMTLQVIDGDPVQGWCPSTSTFMPDTVMFNRVRNGAPVPVGGAAAHPAQLIACQTHEFSDWGLEDSEVLARRVYFCAPPGWQQLIFKFIPHEPVESVRLACIWLPDTVIEKVSSYVSLVSQLFLSTLEGHENPDASFE
jgi:hypothetical protein